MKMESTEGAMPSKVGKGSLGLAVAVFLVGCLLFNANADTVTITQTVDGVTWQLMIDTAAMTARLGTGAGKVSAEASSMAVLKGMPGSLVVPSSFMIDGESYVTSIVEERAFARDRAGILHNITFPLDLGGVKFRDHVFIGSSISNILFKGPSCASPGSGQKRFKIVLSGSGALEDDKSIIRGCSGVNHVVVGPNVIVDNVNTLANFFDAATGAKIFVPRNSQNMTWNGSHEISLGGVDNSAVYYGPSESFDLAMYDTYATFTPITAEGLAYALSLAQTFETGFGLDTRIAITNRINMTTAVAEPKLQNVTLTSPPWYMTFAVQTQAQLDNVLAVVQEDIPVIIDIDGATEDVCVPEGRQVAILAKGGWTFGKKHKGLIIQFK